jgi:hypothetical protein
MDIVFTDLTHDGHPCNFVPYGIALVAANARAVIGAELSVRLVKKPAELASCLEEKPPGMVCFSLFLWNAELSCAFARRIKTRYPECITVFGGPHYPRDAAGQRDFLHRHPEADFFVPREGEAAFVELYRALFRFGFDVLRLKGAGAAVPGCHYCHAGVLVAGTPLPVIDPLDSLPSPYLTGLCDRFLEEGHPVIMETVRGCPFRCTYCREGDEYSTVVRRHGAGRVGSELQYIAARARANTLVLADSNFGMYPEDLETAHGLARVQQEHGWPETVLSIAGKNNKEQVLRTAAPIRGAMLSAAIQSSDPAVLANINRHNVSIQGLIESALEKDPGDSYSFSELIVALPGDSFASHCQSAADLIDAGIHVVRSHQLLMLPGVEISSAESRQRFGLQTRFRVTPHTAGTCSVFGERFHAPEIDEICVGSNTMPFQEYLACRHFDLTVELFYNYGLFAELQAFLKQQGILVSEFIRELDGRVEEAPPLARLYAGFMEDTRELWESREALELFLDRPGVLERYQAGELGRNEQLAFKGYAIFELMIELVELAHDTAKGLLSRPGPPEPRVSDYLGQLKRYELLRKQNPLSVDGVLSGTFHYDFRLLRESGVTGVPWECRTDDEVVIRFAHSERQRRFVAEAKDLLARGLNGYAAVMSRNPKIHEYFREIS